jgi:uncharacterized protein
MTWLKSIICFLAISHLNLKNVEVILVNKKILFFILVICLTISSFSFAFDLVIEDDANLLSAEETEMLRDKMEPLTQYGNIIFKSINNNNFSSTNEYARNYYYNKYRNESGTILIIDMQYRYVYIVSAGNNYATITNKKAEVITDNIYRYLSSKNYYEGSSKAIEQLNTLLEGGKIFEPMRYISNILIALIISAFLNFFFIMRKSAFKKVTNKELVKDCVIAFSTANIIGNVVGTTRKYSPRSSSSGSGGGFSGGGRRRIFWRWRWS